MLCKYLSLRYLQEYHTIMILLVLLSTFTAFPLFTPKAITMAPLAESPIDEFYTCTFGHHKIINLFPISFGRMKADFFFCQLFLDPTCSKCTAN